MAVDPVADSGTDCHRANLFSGVAYCINKAPPILCQLIHRPNLLLPTPVVAIRDKSYPGGNKRLHALRRFDLYSTADGSNLTNITQY